MQVKSVILWTILWAAAWACLAPAGLAADDLAKADAVIGVWTTEGGESRVRIEREDGEYVGSIIWLKEPRYPEGEAEAGKAKRDRHNPDEAKRERPIIGLKVLEGFRYDDGEWTGGTIYDPKNGKTYRCRIRMEGEVLHVRGYIGTPLLGRTTEWKRYKEPEPESDAKAENSQASDRPAE
jgi:uncharacterized protein (DUF2147 family)